MAVIGHYVNLRQLGRRCRPSGPVKYAPCLPLTQDGYLVARSIDLLKVPKYWKAAFRDAISLLT